MAKRTHELKAWPSFYDAVAAGDKTFEVRHNDRDFAVGDTLILRRWCPHKRYWTDDAAGKYPQMTVVVTYVMPGGRFGIDPNFCVLGFREPTLDQSNQ